MRKHITVEKITIAGIVITILLLILAGFIFYKNTVYLEQIQRKEIAGIEKKPTEETVAIKSNLLFPDSREIFRPALLKSSPITGFQLSIAEYLIAVYILNLNYDNSLESVKEGAKRKNEHDWKKDYYMAKIRCNESVLLLLVLSVILTFLLVFFFNDKIRKSVLNQGILTKVKQNDVLKQFVRFNYSKTQPARFIYCYNTGSLKHLRIFRTEGNKFSRFKPGQIKLKTGTKLSLKNRKVKEVK